MGPKNPRRMPGDEEPDSDRLAGVMAWLLASSSEQPPPTMVPSGSLFSTLYAASHRPASSRSMAGADPDEGASRAGEGTPKRPHVPGQAPSLKPPVKRLDKS
jgi:hypothetical protein